MSTPRLTGFTRITINQAAYWFDVFTLASVTPTVVLTHVPTPNSLTVYLNGIEQRYAVDWSISGGVNLAVLAAMDAQVGDVLDCRYGYTP